MSIIKTTFCLQHQRFSLSPHRLIFTDPKDPKNPDKDGQQSGQPDEEKNKAPKKETVRPENAREMIAKLAGKKKISDADASKAFKILSEGDEDERQKLLKFLQSASDGNLNTSEWKNFLGDFDKKTAKTEQEKDKQKKPELDKDELKFDIKSKIGAQTSEAIDTAEKLKSTAQAGTKTPRQKEIAEQFGNLKADFQRFNEEEQKYSKPIQKELAEMVENNQISAQLAQKIFKLDLSEDDAGDQWEVLTRDIKDPKAKSAVAHVLELKKQQAENDKIIEREYQEKMHKLRELTNEIGKEVMLKAAREKSIQGLSGLSGLPLKPGQVLTYKLLEENEQTKLVEEKKHYATIKEIRFDDIEIKDENGKLIKKVPSTSPTIVIESADTDKKRSSDYTPQAFLEWVEKQDATEDIQNEQELAKSIGHAIKKGEKFEFRELIEFNTPKYSNKDILVEINHISPDRKQIELNQEVLISQGNRGKTLSFNEFARWFKRNEVMKPITSLEQLRTELRGHNEALNAIYERDAAQYPAIEAKPGEVLHYDDNTDRTFVIKEIDDKKVLLDNGESFTPAAFLRWVKRNEVQKKDPNAEAAKASARSEGTEKEQIEALTAAKIAAQNAERIAAGKAHESPNGAANDNANLPEKYVIHSTEEPSLPTTSYGRKLWNNTTIVSLSDLWEIGKGVYEFVDHKLDRWKKGRVGLVGSRMFGWYTELGGEFKSKAQSAENEVVNHHAEVYRTMGPDFLKHEMHEATDKDVFKACITVLCEKGQMRWDDPLFWKAVDNLSDGHPTWVESTPDYMDNIGKVLDSFWGPDSFREFVNKQDSSYNSIKSNFTDNAKRLEGDPFQNGGLRGALQKLLYKHMHGEYVNPCEYERYLDFAIEAGKMSFGDKIFFLIMGVAAESPGHHGHPGSTLLHIDRVGAIESDRLNNFPVLDFFTKKMGDITEDGTPIMERNKETGVLEQRKTLPTMRHFRYWMKHICQKDVKGGSFANVKSPQDLRFDQNIRDFVEQTIIWNEGTRARMEKSASDVTRYDHEDLHMLVAMMSEELVEQITKKAGGARQQVSNEGIRDAFLGLNHLTNLKMQLMKKHLKEGKKEEAQHDLRQLIDLSKTFIRLDAIISRRAYHKSPDYARFSDQDYSRRPQNDSSRPLRAHIDEMRNFIGGLAEKFQLKDEFGLLMNATTPLLDEQQTMVLKFGKLLEGKMQKKSVEEINQIFEENQEKARNSKAQNDIKGMISKLKDRKQEQAFEEEGRNLRPYQDEKVEEKVGTLNQIKEKLRKLGATATDPATLAREQKIRLPQILLEVETKNYIPQDNDTEILDIEIERLQSELREKENQFKSALRGMPATNTNQPR